MHNSKTKSTFASSFPDEGAEGALRGGPSTKITEIFPYPEVWKRAFTLGRNVRFTRTPEVEILRRRIEADPIFAKKFKIFTEQEKKRLTDVTVRCDGKTAPSKLTGRSVNSEPVGRKMSLHHARAIGQLLQQIDNISVKEDMRGTELQIEDIEKKEKPVFHLSDDVFFECGPFVLERLDDKIAEKDAKSINFANNEVALSAVSAFGESIAALYRVLEYHFLKFDAPIISGTAIENIRDIGQTGSLTHSKTGNMGRAESQMCNSGLVMENSSRVFADLEDDTVITDIPSDVAKHVGEGAVKSLEDASGSKVKRKTQRTPRALSVSRDSLDLNCHPLNCSNYEFPPVDLLQDPVFHEGTIITQETLERGAGLLESVLEDFGIKGEVIHVHPGPVVTMYEFEPAAGVKSSRVIGLSDDIARSMSAISTRVAVIPGRNVIGIELPNAVRETVYLRELIQSSSFRESSFKLALALGKGINGKPVIAELAKMPHLLVAGTTGSGKSVAINAMILSILYRMTPEQCRLIMVDPKMLELSVYDGIPHLLTPVVTDPKKAVTALKWAVREMEERYRKMAKLGVRNIDSFNARVALAAQRGERIMCTVQSGFDKESGEVLYHEEEMDLTQLPYLVVIVDEMADLMMVAGKEIENAIQRLAQMARAAGIHLIMATQRPSVDVITGTIKANFPTRISFQVTSKIDSRTILGEQGAETLLGQGDMLHMAGGGRIVRVHGPFVSDEEVESVVAHLKMQGNPDYLATVTDSEEDNKDPDSAGDAKGSVSGNSGDDNDELYLRAVKIVMRDRKCSTSYIQRRLAIGYNKAASIVEKMEEKGIVGAANHVGKREILLNDS
ncbi:DNA translocase FtsK [Bartonella sp. CB178]|uniref:DNA translocase FtsK n=1 Tax=Bartonella sp. CB178 TaxID=3112255 RepID=UPI00300E6B92